MYQYHHNLPERQINELLPEVAPESTGGTEFLSESTLNNYDLKLSEAYSEVDLSTAALSSQSIGGGYNSEWNRLKVVGHYQGADALDELVSYFNEKADSTFRVCARYQVDTEQQLLEIASFCHSSDLLELEYYYPTKGNTLIAGVGINGPDRLCHNPERGHYYFGSESLSDPQGSRQLPPKGLHDLQQMRSQQKDRYSLDIPVNPEFELLHGAGNLSLDQRYQLASLYLNAFGAGWTIDEVCRVDDEQTILKVLVERSSREVVAACLAESDETTVEFTEWVATPGHYAASVMVAAAVIEEVYQRYPDKMLYGEFRTTSGSATQALRLGFAPPPTIAGIESDFITRGNVAVEGELTDLAIMIHHDPSRSQ